MQLRKCINCFPKAQNKQLNQYCLNFTIFYQKKVLKKWFRSSCKSGWVNSQKHGSGHGSTRFYFGLKKSGSGQVFFGSGQIFLTHFAMSTCDVGTAQCEDGTIKCEKKSKGTIKCEKRTLTCDVGTAQCEDRTVKCEKKIREPPNETKEFSHVRMKSHNVRMKPSNVRKKSKGTAQCEKRTVTCDVGTA